MAEALSYALVPARGAVSPMPSTHPLTFVGLLLILGSAANLAQLARVRAPYRVGPWPGLTAHGAALLLAAATLLAGTQLALGQAEVDVRARSPVTYVPLVTLGAVAVLTVAARVTSTPGAALAACGAYLLPRSLTSLLVPSIALPALLLVPALLLELVLWTRASDVALLAAWWPRSSEDRRRRQWEPKDTSPRTVSGTRALAAGALFGASVGLFEPANAVFQGAEPADWVPVLPLLVAASGLLGGLAAWLAACATWPGSATGSSG